MLEPENIFDFYRKKIETRYNIWIGFLAFLCIILFIDQYFSEEDWILRGVQDAIKYASLGLVFRLLLNRNSLLTILDHRYTDSIQRYEGFILDKENNSSKLKKERFQFLVFLVVISAISYFVIESKNTVAMCAAIVLILPIAFILQAWFHAQDKKILQQLKESLQRQALDMST